MNDPLTASSDQRLDCDGGNRVALLLRKGSVPGLMGPRIGALS